MKGILAYELTMSCGKFNRAFGTCSTRLFRALKRHCGDVMSFLPKTPAAFLKGVASGFALFLVLSCHGSAFGIGPEPESDVRGGRPVIADATPAPERWAFRKLTEAQPPSVIQTNAPVQEIDRFVLARLDANRLRPSPVADRRTLLRRVTYDLIGLPPSPEELQDFLSDSSATAYEKVVDRLLDSPHFGERWARHWLDVVRFAESHGFERNTFRPHAWRYRDWVIQAFNEDLPYDEFVRLQLAGDTLKPDDPAAIIATAYLAGGPHDILGSDSGTEAMKAATREDELEDIVGNLGQTFLGLTIQCARCHAHKFDPVLQKEYYQIAASVGGVWPGTRDALSEGAYVALQKERDRFGTEIQRLRPRLTALDEAVRQQIESDLRSQAVRSAEESETKANIAIEEARRKLEENQLKLVSAPESDKAGFQKTVEKAQENLKSKAHDLTKAKAAIVTARESNSPTTYGMVLDRLPADQRPEYRRLVLAISRLEMRFRFLDRAKVDAIAPRQPKLFHVLERGDFRKPGEIVVPAGLSAIRGPRTDFGLAADAPEAQRRAKLAEWMTDSLNPFLPRVIVNRLWHYHFGIGLVDTPNDFGANGGRPSHPELLDWLASELVRNGWSLKKLHRLLVTSAVYRQSSRSNADGMSKDNDNRMLWRMSPRRLEGETVRDAVLSVCGELNPEMGGPSFHDVEAEKSGDNTAYAFVNGFSGELNRRTIYRRWVRRAHHPLLDALDCADPSISVPRRPVTTTPLQALSLLNNLFMLRAADAFALRLEREAGHDVGQQIERAYRLAYLRGPTEEEARSVERFIADHGLSQCCLVIFNSNEFVYVD